MFDFNSKGFLLMLLVAALAFVLTASPVGPAVVVLIYLLRKVSRMPTEGNGNNNNSSNNS